MRVRIFRANGLAEIKQLFVKSALIFISVFFFGAWCAFPANTLLYKNTPFKDGEVLRYKVKWGFIRLGTIEISQQIINSPFSSRYLVQLQAKSTNFSVVLNADSPTHLDFVLKQNKDKETKTVYRYDLQNRLIHMESWEEGNLVKSSSLFYEDAYYDPLGLIMMMRCLSAPGLSVTLPTIVDFGIKETDLNFTGVVKNIKVSAFHRRVKARQVKGTAKWKAWAGINGPFKGWFSDDEAAIPLKIYLKIFLGSIVLELEKLHRPDWLGTDIGSKQFQKTEKEVSRQ